MVKVQHQFSMLEDVDVFAHRFVVEVCAGGKETMELQLPEIKELLLKRLDEAVLQMQELIRKGEK